VGNVDLIEARASQRNAAHSAGMQSIQNRRVQLVIDENADSLTIARQRCRLQVQRFGMENPFNGGTLSLLL
jgi:hypothetical protein